MKVWLRRGLLVLALSTVVSAVFLPLGQTDWAHSVRAKRAAQREARRSGDGGQARERREPPPALLRIVGPVLKETVLMGVPATMVVLLSFAARRLRR